MSDKCGRIPLSQKGETHMNRKRMILLLGSLTICLTLAPGLWAQASDRAGCGYYEDTAAKLKPAAFVEASEDNAVITGLWKAKLIAKGNANIPDGTIIDDGYATWHADGTELLNSSRSPLTSSFCMGVWKQTKRNTFKLNHVALSWDTSGTVFVGPANIRELVTVDRTGNNYSGTFNIMQYDTNGNVLAKVVGVVTAQRITAD
jgi:hypothetical protein